MLKKTLQIYLIILFCITLSGCNNNYVKESNLQEDNQNLKVFTSIDYKDYKNLEICTIDLDFNHIYLSEIHNLMLTSTYYDDKIYYSILNEEILKEDTIEVYSFDLKTNENKLIYQYVVDKEDKFHLMNELRATDDYLFWVEMSVDGRWVFKEFDLNTKETKVIREYEDEMMLGGISISLTKDFIFWYEIVEEYEDYMIARLASYDINEKNIGFIEENAYIDSPYLRVSIYNNNLAFLTETEENETKIINIYDLNTRINSEYSIENINNMGNIVGLADNLLILYDTKDIGNTDIYLYDYKSSNYQQIKSPGSMFFANEYEGKIFINLYSEVYFLDLENNYKVYLEKAQKKDGNKTEYYYPRKTLEDKYIIHFSSQEGKDTKRGYYLISNINK